MTDTQVGTELLGPPHAFRLKSVRGREFARSHELTRTLGVHLKSAALVRLSILLSAGLLPLLSGCAADTAAPQENRVQYNKDPEQCANLQSYSGDLALMQNLNITNVQKAAFDKPYNRADLEAVLGASNDETYKYGFASGIEIYKIPLDVGPDACLFQKDLPAAPENLSQFWLSNLMPTDPSEGYVDGVFLAAGISTYPKRSIVIRETAGRRTLVHELMHYNFWKTRTALNGSDWIIYGALNANGKSASEAYDTYKASETEANLTALAQKVYERALLSYDALVIGSFEEIADEGLLLDEWSAGRLKMVSKRSLVSAAWYINYSKDSADKDLREVGSLNEWVKTEATAKSFLQIATVTAKTDGYIANNKLKLIQLAAKAVNQTASLRPPEVNSGALEINQSLMELSNAHVAAMSNTRELVELRRGNKKLLAELGRH